ncbi:MAG: WYL domain-containing protein [Muribaculaceae bacterium]|nr:WYL domain-containing protein [Muribaculaceae bacterium]
MPKDLFSKYVWIIDTIRRHGNITRSQLSEKWIKSPVSQGQPLTRRTFYNYRMAIEELFQVSIDCNPVTYEYFIRQNEYNDESITNWLLNAAVMSDVLNGARDVSDRIFVEDIPSARVHLDAVIEALKSSQVLRFTYNNYMRALPQTGIKLEPYFLKLFRQRWYITGRNVRDRRLKTYALDRISDLSIEADTFALPEDFDARAYFNDAFGIIFDEGQTHTVRIKVDVRQAKYFRALPLHHSQQESVHDTYSIFSYHMKLTPDFLSELLSFGPKITILDPPQLRAMLVSSLEQTLDNYRRLSEG